MRRGPDYTSLLPSTAKSDKCGRNIDAKCQYIELSQLSDQHGNTRDTIGLYVKWRNAIKSLLMVGPLN